jgi:hypothetical protein
MMSDAKRSKMKKRKDIGKQEAFLEFKLSEDGLELEQSIKDNRQELKNIKVSVKDLTEKCNHSKKSIDKVKSELDKKQEERRQNQGANMLDDDIENEEGHQEIIDEEELQLLTHLKDLKKEYRNCF